MVLADAHIHLFRTGYAGRYGRSPAGADELTVYASLRAEHDIAAALVVGFEGRPEYAGNNDYLRELAAGHPWIIPLAYVEAREPVLPDRIRALAGAGFAGLSIYAMDRAAGDAIAGWPAETIRAIDEFGGILSVNATPEAVAVASPTFAALSSCPVLFSHLGLPGRHASTPTLEAARAGLAPLLALAGQEHIGVKYSGLYAISDPAHAYPHHAAEPFIRLLLEHFGVERLYWGSDFSPALDHVSFAQSLDVDQFGLLSDDELALVRGGNLSHLLGPDAAAPPADSTNR